MLTWDELGSQLSVHVERDEIMRSFHKDESLRFVQGGIDATDELEQLNEKGLI